MRRLIIMVILIVAGIEFGGMAFDALQDSVKRDHAALQQKVNELREH